MMYTEIWVKLIHYHHYPQLLEDIVIANVGNISIANIIKNRLGY